MKENKDKVSRISMVVDEKVSEITKASQQNNTIREVGVPFFKK